jgi:hypothetical protein
MCPPRWRCTAWAAPSPSSPGHCMQSIKKIK